MKAVSNAPIPSPEEVLEGMRRAVNKVIEEAKRDDRELVIVRDGQIVKIKARDL